MFLKMRQLTNCFYLLKRMLAIETPSELLVTISLSPFLHFPNPLRLHTTYRQYQSYRQALVLSVRSSLPWVFQFIVFYRKPLSVLSSVLCQIVESVSDKYLQEILREIMKKQKYYCKRLNYNKIVDFTLKYNRSLSTVANISPVRE